MSRRRPAVATMVAVLAALWGATGASAQPEPRVWRCGADARQYSQQPCESGGRAVEVADARTARQVDDATRVAARDARLAETLAQERKQRERAASRQGAAHIGHSRGASAPEQPARPKAPKKSDPRRARDDGSMTPPLKAFAAAG